MCAFFEENFDFFTIFIASVQKLKKGMGNFNSVCSLLSEDCYKARCNFSTSYQNLIDFAIGLEYFEEDIESTFCRLANDHLDSLTQICNEKYPGNVNEINATLERFNKFLNWHKLAFKEWREYVIFKFTETRNSSSTEAPVSNYYGVLQGVLAAYRTKITCMLDADELRRLAADVNWYEQSLQKAIVLTVIKPLVSPPPTVSLLCDNVEAKNKASTPVFNRKLPTIDELHPTIESEVDVLTIAALKGTKKRKAKEPNGVKDDESVASSTASTGRSTRRRSILQ